MTLPFKSMKRKESKKEGKKERRKDRERLKLPLD